MHGDLSRILTDTSSRWQTTKRIFYGKQVISIRCRLRIRLNLCFCDEATFHLSGKINRHKIRIWGRVNPHETRKVWSNTPKVNVWCVFKFDRVMGPFLSKLTYLSFTTSLFSSKIVCLLIWSFGFSWVSQ